MKIKKVTERRSFLVETDDPYYPIYIRYLPNYWENQMGESVKMIEDLEKLERLFIEYMGSLN